jgi:hypothetical protein
MTQCKTKKRRFRDEIAAKLALSRMVCKDKGAIRVYHCNLCRGFHITSQPQRTTI